jgi:pSer/pThr/pTyr-binding forkhead associated (FHA) protein
VPQSLLHVLNVFLLALLFLFFLRVMRAMWVQVNAPPIPPPIPVPTPAAELPPRPVTTSTGGLLRLRVIEPPERKGETYDPGDEVTVGRAPGCGVSLPDATVSQLHARVFRRDGRLYVEDLGSTNGTFVNRARVSAPVPLNRGDRLQVGGTVLEVSR